MPSTTAASTKVFVPYLSWRRPSPRATTSQRRTRCSSTSASAATSQGRSPPGSVLPARLQARAATASAKPSGARKSSSFFSRFMVSRPPALALHRLVGEEDADADHAQVEHDVLQVHDALDQVLEVRRDAEVG